MKDLKILIQVLMLLDLEKHGVSHNNAEKLIVRHCRLLRSILDNMKPESIDKKKEEYERRLR